ncbi:MAG: hypothetical protein ABI181_03045 [Mycobacteriaceae bacterium]
MKQPWGRRRTIVATGSGSCVEPGSDLDARTRADATLSAARSRNSSVVTLEVARSPADSCATVRIPRHVVTAANAGSADPDSTQVIPVAHRT